LGTTRRAGLPSAGDSQLPDVWISRDYPVLREVVRRRVDAGERRVILPRGRQYG
jgi:hypothetical protein